MLSALLSLKTEGDAKLRQKRFNSAVGALTERPVRQGRTICRRQIQHGCGRTCVWIVCFRKRCLLRKHGRSMSTPTACLLRKHGRSMSTPTTCLLRKRGRSMSAPTACLLRKADNQKNICSKGIDTMSAVRYNDVDTMSTF